jgi:hypothetical protein
MYRNRRGTRKMTETVAAEITTRPYPDNDRYVTVDGTHSVRDTVDNHWLEFQGREDLTPEEAHDLREEYRWS